MYAADLVKAKGVVGLVVGLVARLLSLVIAKATVQVRKKHRSRDKVLHVKTTRRSNSINGVEKASVARSLLKPHGHPLPDPHTCDGSHDQADFKI